jgi:surfactin family lipopeptide synthetase A
VTLPHFPLTENGKLDRRALPRPTAEHYRSVQYEPPRGVAEEYLCEVWKDLLGVAQVGRLNNFFFVGGNSIQAMMLSVRIAERFNVRLPTLAFFQAQALWEMAELIDQALRTELSPKAMPVELDLD